MSFLNKITTPTTLDGMMAKVKGDSKISENIDDQRVQKKIDEVVRANYSKYEDVLSKGDLARNVGTAGTLGADALYVASGGLGSFIKLYTVAGRTAVELPDMLRIA